MDRLNALEEEGDLVIGLHMLGVTGVALQIGLQLGHIAMVVTVTGKERFSTHNF